MTPTLTIIRGLPGSGKSTLAKTLMHKDAAHLEADMYFMQDGEYVFDRTKLHQAHSWCMNETLMWLVKGYDVIVSNTFTTMKELQPYLDIAKKTKANVKVYRCTGKYGSVHNVPEETMRKMEARFADYDEEEYYDNRE